ncbi:MAG: CRISPR-associated endonuclease Cas1 [Patescibacteria group bacterium]|mgnify:FL=1
MRRPLIAENYGDFISVSKEKIIFKNKDIVESVLFKELSYIVIKGSYVSFSSALFLRCLKRDIPIVLLDDLDRPYSVISKFKRSAGIKERQSDFSNSKKSTDFVLKILRQKIRKQHQVLHYHIRSLRLNKGKEIKILEGYDFRYFIKLFGDLVKKRLPAIKISRDIFLLEARSSRAYWLAFSRLFPKSIFPGRRKRNSDDPVNKLLNYGYALLSSITLKTMVLAGLDPTVPLLHHRKSLNFPFVFDLMEPFRPINDHIVISFLHKQKKDVIGRNGELRKSVLKRFRKFWFKEIKESEPWSKSKKPIEKFIIELIEKYKKSAYING